MARSRKVAKVANKPQQEGARSQEGGGTLRSHPNRSSLT
jgi:hypothetical protein